MQTHVDDLRPGTSLGGYTLEQCVGRGGSAEVWRASSSEIGRRIALKIMPTRQFKDYLRFRQEAEVQTLLRHPNIVQTFGLRLVEGYAILELEYVQGQTLMQWLTAHRPTILQCEDWILQLLDGLDVAHQLGIIHRDIKASNILIDESVSPPTLKLADFGIARMQHAPEAGITTSGAVVGTPGYMAPEQILGHTDLDLRVDLFALGALSYRLLTGRLPFGGGSNYEIFNRACTGQYTPPHLLKPDLPERFAHTIEAALSIQRADRPASVSAFRDLWTGASTPHASTPHASTPHASSAQDIPPLSVVDRPTAEDDLFSRLQTNRRVHKDRFHGRADDLPRLVESLTAGRSCVMTLKGPGGVGKTRLADEVLAALDIADWPGGIWRCSLTSARTIGDLIEVMRAIFELRLPNNTPILHLGKALNKRGRCVLLLDNLEQIIVPAGALVERLTELAPELSILTTSRSPLGIRGETVVAVEPVAPEVAAALFINRAQSARPSFAPTDEQLEIIGHIVRHLEHLPLALELAASRLRLLSLAQLVRHLEGGTHVLRQTRRGQTARHSSLQQTIAWSWGLLRPWEQLALAQCSVFCGGFTLDAIDEVLSLEAFEESPWAIDVIEALVEQSLLRLETSADGVMRFDLYVSIREFAASQLLRTGAVCTADGASLTGVEAHRAQQRRHARYYSTFGHAESMARLQGRSGAQHLATMARELPNFTAAYQLTPSDDEPELVDAPGYAALSAAMVLLRTGQTHTALPILEQAWKARGIGIALGAQLGSNLGVCCRMLGRMDQAIETITTALASIPADMLPAQQAKLLQHLGNMTRQQGDFVTAQESLHRALALARGVHREDLVGLLSSDLGAVAFLMGNLDDAQERFEQSVQLQLDCELLDSANLTRGNLVLVALKQGRHHDARQLLEVCVSNARERGHRRQQLIFSEKIAQLELELGRYEAAEAALHEANALNEGVGDRRRQGDIVRGLGVIRLMRDEHAAAQELLEESARLTEGVDPHSAYQAHGLLSVLAAKTQRLDDVTVHLTAAAAQASRAGPAAELELVLWRAEVALILQQLASARIHLAQAHDMLKASPQLHTHQLRKRVASLEGGLSTHQ